MRKLSLIPEEATLSYSKSIEFPIQPKGFQVISVSLPPVSIEEKEQANSSSLEQGKNQASSFYQKEIAKLREEYASRQENLLSEIQNKVEKLIEELDQRLPSLVVNIAQKVLGGIELDAEMIQSSVKSMIQEFGKDDEKMDVFLCPRDLNLLKSFAKPENKPETNESDEGFASAIAGIFDGIDGDDAVLEGFPNVKFFEDPTLQSGDCQVKSRFGLLDGRIATKLRRLEEEINGD